MSDRAPLDSPPPFSDARWDLPLAAGALIGLGVAWAFRSWPSLLLVGAAGFVLLKVRLSRIDAWNAGRPSARRIGAGSKLNQLFAVTSLVWGLGGAILAWRSS